MDTTLFLLDTLQALYKFEKVAFFPLNPLCRMMYLKQLKGAGKKYLFKISFMDSQESASKNLLAIARLPDLLPSKVIFDSIRQDANAEAHYQSNREKGASTINDTKSKSAISTLKMGDNNLLQLSKNKIAILVRGRHNENSFMI